MAADRQRSLLIRLLVLSQVLVNWSSDEIHCCCRVLHLLRLPRRPRGTIGCAGALPIPHPHRFHCFPAPGSQTNPGSCSAEEKISDP